MLLISLQADLCNHCGRNLEYLEGQLESHRLLQRNKMEIADRQVVLSYALFSSAILVTSKILMPLILCICVCIC